MEHRHNGSGINSGFVICVNAQGLPVQGEIVHLTRHRALFQIFDPQCVLQSSELLKDFQIQVEGRPIYQGRAVVNNYVHSGSGLLCEASLEDSAFNFGGFLGAGKTGDLAAQFHRFLECWQKSGAVLPEFKIAVTDIENFLLDFRHWLEHLEVGTASHPQGIRADTERQIVMDLSQPAVQILDELFARYESIAQALSPEMNPAHRAFVQRHLHRMVLCAPFAYRTYQKPLGYAGDYEMVDMMLRDPCEGGSLYAKVFNVWLLQQGTAKAHRNRIGYLVERLTHETERVWRQGRNARIYNLGCGPVREYQDFLRSSPLSEHAEMLLLDFNDETLAHVRQVVVSAQKQHGRRGQYEVVKKSVQQVIKDSLRTGRLSLATQYDYVYCAGLFDYLPDHVCKHLLRVFYRSLAPGGLVVATNVASRTPNRGSMELILDWHLIYRDAFGFRALAPADIPPENVRVFSDVTGINLFLELRKPDGDET